MISASQAECRAVVVYSVSWYQGMLQCCTLVTWRAAMLNPYLNVENVTNCVLVSHGD